MADRKIFRLMLHIDSHQCQNAVYWRSRGDRHMTGHDQARLIDDKI